MSIVRENLLTRRGYTPYCGGGDCDMPRTRFDGEQFACGACCWRSSFEPEFIAQYKAAQLQLARADASIDIAALDRPRITVGFGRGMGLVAAALTAAAALAPAVAAPEPAAPVPPETRQQRRQRERQGVKDDRSRAKQYARRNRR